MSEPPQVPGLEFIRPIGKGAMGAVYLARQTALGRTVAVKQILGAWQGDAEALERFRREARALARMNHPNVVALYDLATGGQDLFMVMEFVEGVTLKDVMDRGVLSAGQSLDALRQMADGLDYAHQAGIVHRDLKPANVFVSSGGLCKLGDFGLVKMTSGAAGFATQLGAIMGTPAYMSPEQAQGRADIGHRADIYALGIIAYQMLVGRLPFPPVAGNMMASLDAQVNTPPPLPRTIDAAFPEPLEAPLLAALAKDPAARPASAGAYVESLLRAAEATGLESQGDLAEAMASTAAATSTSPAASIPAPVEPGVSPPVGGGLRSAVMVAPTLPVAAASPRRAGAWRFPVAVLAGIAVLLAAFIGISIARRSSSGAGALAVSAVDVEVAPGATGHCPSVHWVFSGHIRTNGAAGAVRFQWLQPDGTLSGPQDVTVPRDSHLAEVGLQFQLDSPAAWRGVAALRVLSPTAREAQVPLAVTCP